MSLRFFTIPIHGSEVFEQELNQFLASHRVLAIERHVIDAGVNSCWAICVDYLDGAGKQVGTHARTSRNRIDYKTILSPDEFTVFCQLREFRKETAQSEAVPVYAVFTNEQLALMVQRRCQTKSDLQQIEGIGEAKVAKYAERMLNLLKTVPEANDAASSKSV